MMEDTHELLDIVASYTPAPDIRPILLDTRRDAIVWQGPYTYGEDNAAKLAMAKRVELEQCCHCTVGADFVEVTEYGLISWCSLYAMRDHYYPKTPRVI